VGGWEVGLHGGHETYNNPAEIKSEEQKLEAVLSHLLALWSHRMNNILHEG